MNRECLIANIAAVDSPIGTETAAFGLFWYFCEFVARLWPREPLCDLEIPS